MNSPEGSAASREPELVRQMFAGLAARYDFANHVLSVGCDVYWRNRAARMVAGWKPACILDVATGTGDLALALARRLPKAEVVGADFSPEMLGRARDKGLRKSALADVMHLPFAPQAFDAVTVAFGLRNVKDWAAALREMRRVLTKHGHLLILDFSLPRRRCIRAAYRVYLHRILPVLSATISGQRNAYEYLGASIENFPSGAAMCQLIEENGFSEATAEPLTGGIVTIYHAGA